MNGMNVYQGVVESRADPLKSGRCKVRVVGVHTENTQILPTKDLPWAIPLMPFNSASVSGIGSSPTGAVEGSWVAVIFLDGESKQQPMMLGTIPGIPEEVEPTFSDVSKNVDGTVYELVDDNTSPSSSSNRSPNRTSQNSDNTSSGDRGTGNSSTDTAGQQVLTQTDTSPFSGASSTDANGTYRLGQISKQYESGGGGPGTVSSGKGDPGGVSYGTHQLASYRDNSGAQLSSKANNSPVEQFVAQSKWSKDFRGLVPGSPYFTQKWKQVASSEKEEFEEAQYQYFKGQYYTKGANNIKGAGIDLSGRGNAVQEMIWSTSIQYGPGGARKVFVRALDGKDIGAMSDADIIEAVQNDKAKHVNEDFSSSPADTRAKIKNRIASEKAALLNLAAKEGSQVTDESADDEEIDSGAGEDTQGGGGNENTGGGNENTGGGSGVEPPDGGYNDDSEYTPPPNRTPTSGVKVPTTPDENSSDTGFADPDGRYPRSAWLNEPDTHRLARNQKISQTIVEAKRNSLVSGVGIAGGGSWSEPRSPYAAEYPLNHVYYSESGHAREYDDTPNAERVHVYHRQGSFIEWHPDGTVVYKSVKDQFEVTVNDRNIYVGGTCNITVNGDTNIYTQGVHRMESDGDMFIKTASNLRIGAEGTCHIESGGEMYVGSQSNLNCAGSNIFLNCQWSAGQVQAGGYDGGSIAVQVMYDSDVPIPELDEAQVIEDLKKEGIIDSGGGGNGGSSGNGGTNPGTGTDSGGAPVETGGDDTGEYDNGEEPETNPEDVKCEGCCDFSDEDISPSLQLSKNIKLADLTTSAHYPHNLRQQGGLDKLSLAKNLCELANNVLEPLIAKYGRSSFIITSGFRAGSGTSQHLKGQAVDIQFPGLSQAQAAARAKEMAQFLDYDQMILEWHGRNPVFHISHGGSGRKQNLTTPDLKNYFSGFRNKDMSVA
jgi:hypothetical protein